jgi:hypothetical protein
MFIFSPSSSSSHIHGALSDDSSFQFARRRHRSLARRASLPELQGGEVRGGDAGDDDGRPAGSPSSLAAAPRRAATPPRAAPRRRGAPPNPDGEPTAASPQPPTAAGVNLNRRRHGTRTGNPRLPAAAPAAAAATAAAASVVHPPAAGAIRPPSDLTDPLKVSRGVSGTS